MTRSPPLSATPLSPRGNALLALLPPEDLALIVPHLRATDLPRRTVLQEASRPAREAHFFTSGVASVLSYTDEDDAMEIGIMGREGMFGIHSALDVDDVPHKTFMQVGGASLALRVEDLRRLMRESPALNALLLRYASTTLSQTAQLGACNGRHNLAERLARWLLMTQDRVEDDALPITHEFLGLMLGVRRSGVTVALGVLEQAGIIRQQRGGVAVLDRGRLEGTTCACYGLTRMIYRRNLERSAAGFHDGGGRGTDAHAEGAERGANGTRHGPRGDQTSTRGS